jgi:hypothetical protein
MEWISVDEKPITKSGFYKVWLKSGNIHYAKYVKPGCFKSGYGKDYRNGGTYPIKWPLKYIYLFGLNNKWEPDESVKEENWPEGI